MPKVIYEDNKPIYSCNICKRKFGSNVLMAENCEKSHNIVYIKAKPSDIKLLMQYIYTTNGDRRLLSEELMEEFKKIAIKL